MRTALIPGSFDPFHNGHLDVVETASRLFDHVIVAAGRNPAKEGLFTLEERQEMIAECLAHLDNVKVDRFASLVVDVAHELGADVLVKGLRVASDFEYELQQAQMNKAISGLDTLFIPCTSETSFIAASLIRDIARYGGADRAASMVPPAVAARLEKKFPHQQRP